VTGQASVEALLGPAGHIGIVVADLDEGIDAFAPVVGRFKKLALAPSGIPMDTTSGIQVIRFQAAYSLAGPPYVELVQGVSGSLWEPRSAPYLHHLGYWISLSQMASASAALAKLGFPWVASRAAEHGETPRLIHHARGEVRVELVDERRKQELNIGVP
jgi:glyoxalase/bleomycin resistance protein/dioxygenase superfamily protein